MLSHLTLQAVADYNDKPNTSLRTLKLNFPMIFKIRRLQESIKKTSPLLWMSSLRADGNVPDWSKRVKTHWFGKSESLDHSSWLSSTCYVKLSSWQNTIFFCKILSPQFRKILEHRKIMSLGIIIDYISVSQFNHFWQSEMCTWFTKELVDRHKSNRHLYMIS